MINEQKVICYFCCFLYNLLLISMVCGNIFGNKQVTKVTLCIETKEIVTILLPFLLPLNFLIIK